MWSLTLEAVQKGNSIIIDLVAYDRHLHAFPDGISIRPDVSEAIGLYFQDLEFSSVI